jgi:hypothetical protein
MRDRRRAKSQDRTLTLSRKTDRYALGRSSPLPAGKGKAGQKTFLPLTQVPTTLPWSRRPSNGEFFDFE